MAFVLDDAPLRDSARAMFFFFFRVLFYPSVARACSAEMRARRPRRALFSRIIEWRQQQTARLMS